MRKIRYRALVRGFSSELGHQFLPLIALGYGGKLWFDHHADGRQPSVSLLAVAPSFDVARMVRDQAVDEFDDVGGSEAIAQGSLHVEPM